MQIAIINKKTLTIEHVYEDSAPNQAKFGGPWGWPTETIHVQMPTGAQVDNCFVEVEEDGSLSVLEDQAKVTAWKKVQNARAKADYSTSQDLQAEVDIQAALTAAVGQNADYTTHLMIVTRALDVIAHPTGHSQADINQANMILSIYRPVYDEIEQIRAARDARIEAFVLPYPEAGLP